MSVAVSSTLLFSKGSPSIIILPLTTDPPPKSSFDTLPVTIKQVEDNAKAMELGPLSKKVMNQINDIFSDLSMNMSKA